MVERTIPTVLVGTSFKGSVAIEAVSRMMTGSVVRLEREPENPKDALAVACHYLGMHVGYIPRQVNRRIANALDDGMVVHCTVQAPPIVKNNRIVTEPKLTVRWDQPG